MFDRIHLWSHLVLDFCWEFFNHSFNLSHVICPVIFSNSSWFSLGRLYLSRMCPFLLGCQVCWHAIVHSILLWFCVFLQYLLWFLLFHFLFCLFGFFSSLLGESSQRFVNFVYLFKEQALGFIDFLYWFLNLYFIDFLFDLYDFLPSADLRFFLFFFF